MKKKTLLIAMALTSPFCCLADTKKTSVDWETLISFLPAIFFFLILLVTTIKLNRDKVKLSDLLTEKDQQVTIPAAKGATPPPQQSVSRFIAFLTGLVSLTIGVCLTTFFIYNYFLDPAKPVDLSNLSTVIWGLGIGVLPYGFNKASAALKP